MHRTVTFWICAFLTATIFAAEPPAAEDVKSFKAKASIAEFDTNVERLSELYKAATSKLAATYEKEMKKLRTELLAGLEDARKEATVSDRLDSAVEIRDAIEAYKKIELSPEATSPVPVKEREELAQLRREVARLKHEAEKSKVVAPLLAARADLHAKLAGSRWAGDGYQILLNADGRLMHIRPGETEERGVWVPIDGTCIIARYNENGYHDAYVFNGDTSRWQTLGLGTPRSPGAHSRFAAGC